MRRVVRELRKHAPFTAVGAASGIAVMLAVALLQVPAGVSRGIFYTLHPAHVVLSALVTTTMYRLHGKGGLWVTVLVGYTGSIGIATLSDALIPYLGASLLGVEMELEIPFIETGAMPVIGLPKCVVVNALAVVGIAIAYLRPATKFPHAGHVLLSTWASLFHFTGFGRADWLDVGLLIPVFAFLFVAVWLPCCVSDIIYPLLWAKEDAGGDGAEHAADSS